MSADPEASHPTASTTRSRVETQVPTRGAPPAWRRRALERVVVVLVALAIGYFIYGDVLFSREIARVPLGPIGSTREAPVALTGGARVLFAVTASRYSIEGGRFVLIEVALLRDGASVATLNGCRAWDFDQAASSSGTDAEHLNGDCQLRVPDGGATALRVTTRLEDPEGRATFESFTLKVLERMF